MNIEYQSIAPTRTRPTRRRYGLASAGHCQLVPAPMTTAMPTIAWTMSALGQAGEFDGRNIATRAAPAVHAPKTKHAWTQPPGGRGSELTSARSARLNPAALSHKIFRLEFFC